MLVRGNKMMPWVLKPDIDPIWNKHDIARAGTLEIKWNLAGVKEDERRRLLPCEIWRTKFPGLTFNDTVIKRLDELK